MASTRQEYLLTQEEVNELLEACKPVPMIALQCGNPVSAQERANAAWEALGKKRGFVGSSAEPVQGKSMLYVSAIPVSADRFTA